MFSSLNEYVNAGNELSEKLQQIEIQPDLPAGVPRAARDASNGDSKPLISPSSSSISTDSRSSSSLGGRVDCSSSLSNSSGSGHRQVKKQRQQRNSSSSSSATASSTSTSDGEEDDETGVHERLNNEGLSLSAGDYILDSSENTTTVATTNEEAPKEEGEEELGQKVATATETEAEGKKATGAAASGPSEQQDTSAFSYKNSLYSDTLSNDVINLEGRLGFVEKSL